MRGIVFGLGVLLLFLGISVALSEWVGFFESFSSTALAIVFFFALILILLSSKTINKFFGVILLLVSFASSEIILDFFISSNLSSLVIGSSIFIAAILLIASNRVTSSKYNPNVRDVPGRMIQLKGKAQQWIKARKKAKEEDYGAYY